MKVDEILGREEALKAIRDAMVRCRARSAARLLHGLPAQPERPLCSASLAHCLPATQSMGPEVRVWVCPLRRSTQQILCPSGAAAADAWSAGGVSAGPVSRELCAETAAVSPGAAADAWTAAMASPCGAPLLLQSLLLCSGLCWGTHCVRIGKGGRLSSLVL